MVLNVHLDIDVIIIHVFFFIRKCKFGFSLKCFLRNLHFSLKSFLFLKDFLPLKFS